MLVFSKPNTFQNLILDMACFLVVYNVRNVFLVAVCWGSVFNGIVYNLWAIDPMVWVAIAHNVLSCYTKINPLIKAELIK